MKSKHEKRTIWVNTRFSPTEYETLQKHFKTTTHKDLAGYTRQVLLNKPVNVIYRNQSIDDFLTDMSVLRKELNAIGNNFNQTVHRLHTLHQLPELQQWLLLNEQDKTQLFRQIESIYQRINQLYQLWSHESDKAATWTAPSSTTRKK
jgi:MobC-like protein